MRDPITRDDVCPCCGWESFAPKCKPDCAAALAGRDLTADEIVMLAAFGGEIALHDRELPENMAVQAGRITNSGSGSTIHETRGSHNMLRTDVPFSATGGAP